MFFPSNSRYSRDCGGGPEFALPDVLGALRGWRYWRLDMKTGYLTGDVYKQRWYPGTNAAVCGVSVDLETPSRWTGQVHFGEDGLTLTHREGYGPDPKCPGIARGNHGCGFFADHNYGLGQLNRPFSDGIGVYGVVDMWGQVELGSAGLRAEFAQIVAFLDPRTIYRQRIEASVREIKMRRQKLTEDPTTTGGAGRVHRNAIRGAVQRIRENRARIELFETVTLPLYGVPVFPDRKSLLAHYPVRSLAYLLKEEPDADKH